MNNLKDNDEQQLEMKRYAKYEISESFKGQVTAKNELYFYKRDKNKKKSFEEYRELRTMKSLTFTIIIMV